MPVPTQDVALIFDEDQPISGTIFPDGIPTGGTVSGLTITDQTSGVLISTMRTATSP